MNSALEELRVMIAGRYPAVTFRVLRGEDPEGMYLETTVDIDDTDEVMDLVVDRLLEMEVDEGLPVYVIPIRPLARVMENLRARATTGWSRRHGTALLPDEPADA